MKNFFNWIKNFILELKHNLKLLYIINIISIILATLPFLYFIFFNHNFIGVIFYIPTTIIFIISIFALRTFNRFPKTTKWITSILGLFIIIFIQIIVSFFLWGLLYYLEQGIME
jgi:hypothetical protein